MLFQDEIFFFFGMKPGGSCLDMMVPCSTLPLNDQFKSLDEFVPPLTVNHVNPSF